MDKFRIAVCDDELIDLNQIITLLRKYDLKNQFCITSYSTADSLLKSTPLKFDIVLLDIEMLPPTGFDAAKALANTDNPPIVIFITKSNAYTLKGYGIAMRYLQKPLQEDLLFEALDAAIESSISHRLTFNFNNATYALKLSEIYYIEVYGHYAYIHTSENQFRIRSTLREIISKLPSGYFAVPHQSFAVNLEHIRSASNTEIELDIGIKIPISRRKATEFSEALYRFLGR